MDTNKHNFYFIRNLSITGKEFLMWRVHCLLLHTSWLFGINLQKLVYSYKKSWTSILFPRRIDTELFVSLSLTNNFCNKKLLYSGLDLGMGTSAGRQVFASVHLLPKLIICTFLIINSLSMVTEPYNNQ